MNALPICPWCRAPVYAGELSVPVDGETYHIDCAAEEEENAFFDRDMEFGS